MGSKRASRYYLRVGWVIALAFGGIEVRPAAVVAQDGDDAGKVSRPVAVPLPAIVTEVSGTVEWAKGDVSPLATTGWTPVKWKDRLEPGTLIRTGLRSFVHLKFGETTYVSLRSATHASIDELYRSADVEHVTLGLGYGTVRGGSVEGTIHSEVRVESPIATLAKRGTEGWQMDVEPITGRFRISLAEFGLVEAIQKARGGRRASRSVRPGEYANESNIANMWIKQDIFDRNVSFYEAKAITAADAEFNSENTRGYGVLSPGGGSTVVDASTRVSADFALEQIAERFPGGRPPTTVLIPPGRVPRPEGNFGTGTSFRVLLPESTRARSLSRHRTLPRPKALIRRRK